MIVLGKNEKLRRRYPADLKKFGKGILYLTSERIMFESEKHGCVMVFNWDRLFNWTKKKKSLILRWYEKEQKHIPEYKRNDVFIPVGDIGSAEFKFGKKNGKKQDLQEIHLSLFTGVTDYYTYGNRGTGFYMDQREKLRHHFFNGLKKEYNVQRTHKGMLLAAATAKTGIKLKLDDATGERLIDQELMAYYKKRNAWAFDGRLDETWAPSKLEQISEHSEFRGCGPSNGEIHEPNDNVKLATAHNQRLEDDIKKLESEGNTGKLEEYIEPQKEQVNKFIHYMFKGGNKYDYLEFCKKNLMIYQRIFDVMSKIDFTSPKQKTEYWIALDKALTEKMEKDGDITNYAPKIELREEKTSKVPAFLTEYREKLVEVP